MLLGPVGDCGSRAEGVRGGELATRQGLPSRQKLLPDPPDIFVDPVGLVVAVGEKRAASEDQEPENQQGAPESSARARPPFLGRRRYPKGRYAGSPMPEIER